MPEDDNTVQPTPGWKAIRSMPRLSIMKKWSSLMLGFCPWFATYKYEVIQHIYMHRYTYHTQSEGDGERERCVYNCIYIYNFILIYIHMHRIVWVHILYIYMLYVYIYVYIYMHIFVGTHARSRKSWLILRLNNELPQRNRRKLKQLPWFELTL